jgi:hypothetical protein
MQCKWYIQSDECHGIIIPPHPRRFYPHLGYLVLRGLLVDVCLSLRKRVRKELGFHRKAAPTSWVCSSILSERVSFAAVARVLKEASLSLATCLLASLLAVAPAPWMDSAT